MHELSRKLSSDLYIPSPPGLDYFPFQRAGIEYAYRNPNHNTLIGDEPGLGKTIQFIGYCNLIGAMNILIICPASLTMNWAREMKKWHVGNPTIQIIFSSKQELNPLADVHIVSFSLIINQEVNAFLQRKKPDATSIDEVHYLKNHKAKRTKAAYIDAGNLMDGASNVIPLSGTPIINRPIEIFETVNKLCPQAIDHMNYEQFAIAYCGGYWDREGFHDQGATNLAQLGSKLRGSFMVRRRKEEVLTDLPGKTVNIVYLEPTKEASRLVKEMKKYDIEEIIKFKGVPIHYDGLSTQRRELGEEKVAAAIDYIKNQLDSGRNKVVVFAHHREVLLMLAEGLEEYGVCLLYGGTKPGITRQNLVDDFQTNPLKRVWVGGIGPCGEGITLTASDYLCFVEPDWVPGKNDQVIDRVHRIGQVWAVLAEFLIYEGSLDENILRSSGKKQKNIREIMA